MAYYIFIENGKINGAGQCKQLTAGFENFEVNEQIYDDYLSNPDKYIWADSKIIENPDYEKIIEQKALEERKNQILKQLDELDKKRIRAVCENEIKDEETKQTWLEFYNLQIQDLRKQLEDLNI